MSALTYAQYELHLAFQEKFEDFKTIWKIFRPNDGFIHTQKEINQFACSLNINADDYFMFVVVLQLYSDRFPVPKQNLDAMIRDVLARNNRGALQLSSPQALRLLYSKELGQVEEAFAEQEKKRLADVRKALGDVPMVPLTDFQALQRRVEALEALCKGLSEEVRAVDEFRYQLSQRVNSLARGN